MECSMKPMRCRLMRRWIPAVAVAVAVCLVPVLRGGARGAQDEKDYAVAVFVSGLPFCGRAADGEYFGFEVELWREIAQRVGIKYHLEETSRFPAALQALSEGKADFALATVTMTGKRAHSMQFLYPYYVSGQGILVNVKTARPLAVFAGVLWSSAILHAVVLLVVLNILYGHILWIVERKKNPLVSERYIPGVLEAMWCAFAIKTTIGFGDLVPRIWLARLIAVPIWLTGIFVVSVISAQMVGEYVAHRFDIGSVANYYDLARKKVTVVEGTTGYDSVKELGPKKIVQVESPVDGYLKLLENEVDAAVFDYPFLVHAAQVMRAEGKKVRVVGQAFTEELIAIPVSLQLAARDPALIARINRTILELRDEGFIDSLRLRYIESLDAG